MLPERIFFPRDIFAVWCVELQHLSDLLLTTAREIAHNEGVVTRLALSALHDANLRLENLQAFARAIMDTPEPEPEAGPTTPPVTSGGGCHVA